MKKIFQNNSFKLLFAGNLVSEIGNSLFGLAMMFYIGDVTGSAISMGAYMFVVAGTRILVSPIAGVLVDKLNKVRVIYITDYIRAIIFVGLWAFVLTDPSQNSIFIALYVVGILSSINAAFFGPAMTSGTPTIVGEENLQAANGAMSMIQSVQNIVGMALGATLYYFFGLEFVIIINAISFGLSGFSEMFIKAKYEKNENTFEGIKKVSFVSDFKESISYMRNRVGLVNMMIYSLFLNFAFTPLFAIGMPYLFNIDLARETAEFEFAGVNIMFSIAMLFASIFIGSIKIKDTYVFIKKGLLSMSFSFLLFAGLMALVSNGLINYWLFYGLYLIAIIFVAVSMIATNVPLNTGMVLLIDHNIRGRVFSTMSAISGGLVPFAILLGSVVIEMTNITILGALCILLVIFPLLGFTTNKKVETLVRSIDDNIEPQI